MSNLFCAQGEGGKFGLLRFFTASELGISGVDLKATVGTEYVSNLIQWAGAQGFTFMLSMVNSETITTAAVVKFGLQLFLADGTTRVGSTDIDILTGLSAGTASGTTTGGVGVNADAGVASVIGASAAAGTGFFGWIGNTPYVKFVVEVTTQGVDTPGTILGSAQLGLVF